MLMIRDAAPDDVERIREIYDHYVQRTAVSFEYETPSPDELRERMRKTQQRYPYLVLERDGRVEGYAYAGPFHSRAAYDWSCEVSIYLDRAAQMCGLGRALYTALEDALREMGVLNLYACIAMPVGEDDYLTANSAQFHAHMGFSLAGTFRKCGYKFGHWYDMIWMEKTVGTHGPVQPPVKAYVGATRGGTGSGEAGPAADSEEKAE